MSLSTTSPAYSQFSALLNALQHAPIATTDAIRADPVSRKLALFMQTAAPVINQSLINCDLLEREIAAVREQYIEQQLRQQQAEEIAQSQLAELRQQWHRAQEQSELANVRKTLNSHQEVVEEHVLGQETRENPLSINSIANDLFLGIRRAAEKNEKQAFEFYQTAAEKMCAGEEISTEKKCIEALVNLAAMHDCGISTPANKTVAFQWYLKAAEAGDAAAMFRVAWAHRQRIGVGVRLNDFFAVYWCKKAADSGHAMAVDVLNNYLLPNANTSNRIAKDFHLPSSYYRRQREEKEGLIKMAHDFYKRAVKLSEGASGHDYLIHQQAMFCLAEIYFRGTSGIEKDSQQALAYLQGSLKLREVRGAVVQIDIGAGFAIIGDTCYDVGLFTITDHKYDTAAKKKLAKRYECVNWSAQTPSHSPSAHNNRTTQQSTLPKVKDRTKSLYNAPAPLLSSQILDVQNRKLEQINLTGLHSLRHLYLQNNGLTELPEGLGQLPLLEQVNISHNKLEKLSEEIGLLPHLTYLDLSHNSLRQLPSSFGQLTALTHLYLNNNNLDSLPSSFKEMKALRFLNLNHNQLEELPLFMCEMRELGFLKLASNQLKRLPPELGRLWGNVKKQFPYQNTTKFDLSDNPFEIMPATMVKSLALQLTWDK